MNLSALSLGFVGAFAETARLQLRGNAQLGAKEGRHQPSPIEWGAIALVAVGVALASGAVTLGRKAR